MTNLIPLTDSTIINGLNIIAREPLGNIIIGGIVFIGFLIFWIVSLKKRDKNPAYIFFVYAVPIMLLIFLYGLVNSVNNYLTTKYYIDSNSWTVVNDKVLDAKAVISPRAHYSNSKYYLYLSKYGRIKVSNHTFDTCSIGDSVYVVIAKDKNGNEQPTGLVYSQKKYIYKDN